MFDQKQKEWLRQEMRKIIQEEIKEELCLGFSTEPEGRDDDNYGCIVLCLEYKGEILQTLSIDLSGIIENEIRDNLQLSLETEPGSYGSRNFVTLELDYDDETIQSVSFDISEIT